MKIFPLILATILITTSSLLANLPEDLEKFKITPSLEKAKKNEEYIKVNIQNQTEDQLFIRFWNNDFPLGGTLIQLSPNNTAHLSASTPMSHNETVFDFGIPLGSQERVVINWDKGFYNEQQMHSYSAKSGSVTTVNKSYTIQSTYNPATKEINIKILKK